jgi:hypothetical protein
MQDSLRGTTLRLRPRLTSSNPKSKEKEDMLHHVDEQVAIAARAGDWQKVESLKNEVYEAFWNTPEGSNLLDTGASMKVLSSRLIDEFARRFSGESIYPGVLMVHRLQEVADDILRAEAVKVAPEPEVEVLTEAQEHERKVAHLRAMMSDDTTSPREVKALRESSVAWRKAWNDAAALDTVSAPEPAETEQRKRLKQFAHLVNASVAARGAGSISPKGGIVTIYAGDKAYEYPVAKFREDLEQATIAGLIN